MIRTIVCMLAAFWLTTAQGVAASRRSTEVWNPVADDKAIVVSGPVRITVLTPRMLRIEVSEERRWEDRATFAIVNRRLAVPPYSVDTAGGYLTLRTSALTLRYRQGSIPNDGDGDDTNLRIAFVLNGDSVTWHPGRRDTQNLKGTCRTLDGANGDNKRSELEDGILSRSGWAVIDESPQHRRGDGSRTFPLETTADGFPWLGQTADAAAKDWYFLGYGHDYKGALADFVCVAGRVPLPPKYIFGYWYSRYWAYSEAEFKALVADIEAHDLPMDVMIMDMDWHREGWTGWSWNRDLIPHPTELIRHFHDHGLRTALNLHPADGIASHEDDYAAVRDALGLGADYKEKIPWRLEDYDFARAFFNNVIRAREREGVDFWWLDWQQHLTSPYTEGLGETFWCNHVFFNDMQRHRPDRRPVIYHRWGGLGCHRYPISFSGDATANWPTLAFEVPFTSMASNVCFTYWGHDIGGHQGGKDDPEMMQRWLQFGVFTPIFRTHATKDASLERRLWKYPNFEQLRQTVRLRYRLFPYIYTAARETYDTGVGICRPLYYDWPEADSAYVREDEYMFGPDILVAPISEPSVQGVSRRTLWLPEGLWWDVSHSRLERGGQSVTSEFTTDEFPYYVKAGAVIPCYPPQRSVATTPDTIILQVVPGGDGEGTLYEDDGDNQDYLRGKYAQTRFVQRRTLEGLELTVEARRGTYDGIPKQRAWKIEMPGVDRRPQRVTLNGRALPSSAYDYDTQRRQLTIDIATRKCAKAFTVRVQ